MSGNLCEHCTAACCRYVALPIDEPENAADFDDIRWYLIHENVSVFREDGDWFISFATPCQHLLPDNGCGIYHTRPEICRKYTTDNCDYHSGDYGWDVHFTCAEHLDAWLQENPIGKKTKRATRKSKSTKRKTATPDRRRSNGRPVRANQARTDWTADHDLRAEDTGQAGTSPNGHGRRRPRAGKPAPPQTDTRGIPLPTLPNQRPHS